MSEISKHLDRAEKHLQKGNSEAALHEYVEVLNENPDHEMAAQAAADLCQTLGRTREAAQLLDSLFDRQISLGQGAAAAATYRKLARLTTPAPHRSLRIAPVLEKTSRQEALEAYESARHGFQARGQRPEAAAALEGIVALEPSAARLSELGELAAEIGDGQRASTAFLQAADLTSENQGGAAEALALYERAHRSAPDNQAAAVAYARALRPDEAEKIASALESFAAGPQVAPEIRALYGQALLRSRRTAEAEPRLLELLQQDATQIQPLVHLIGQRLRNEQVSQAVELARRLEQQQRRAGCLRDYAVAMRDLTAAHAPRTEFLEYLVELFNAANCEHDYCQALLQLFELYYATGNFLKASDCLDRAAEVDPYAPGYQKRLEMLQGKVDERRLRLIAGRITTAVTVDDAAAKPANVASADEPTVLEDLLLQAEIFQQYFMRSRAVERLQRIQKLFPDEELKNEKLRELLTTAGIPVRPRPASPVGEAAPGVVALADEAAVNDIARVTEITRNIQRQGTVKAVLFTAVNDAGRHWKASRCIAVMSTPGKPPSMALEYCAPGMQPSDVHAIVKLVGFLQPLLIAHGPLAIGEEGTAPFLVSLKQFAAGMGINSILAMPLVEGDEHVGLMLLAQCGAPRNWRSTDTIVLKTIADQTVLALSNARLRSLVKNLAVAEEKSGLLKRASYLDVLLSEVRRALQQKSTLTVMLVNFGKASELVRQVGESTVDAMMQQIGQLVSSHVRQNDVALRYDLTTVALILADTGEKEAFLAVDKLRSVVAANLRVPGSATTPGVTVGIAEPVMQSAYDPVDVVTEVINRVETALQFALSEGGNRAHALAPPAYTSTGV